jgi:hypothetical protein
MMTRMEQGPPGGGWVAPGSLAEHETPSPVPPGAPAGPGLAGGGRPVTAAAAPGGVPQVAFRPMTLADILDGGFSIIKARPRRILTLTAFFVVPVQVFAAYLSRNVVDDGFGADTVVFGADPALAGEGSTGAEVWGFLALAIIPSIALVCIAAGIAHLVAGWSVGHDASGREMAGVVARRWWPLLGSFVLVHLAELLGVFACYIGFVFVMTLFCVVAPVIGAEAAGAGGALGRSMALTRERYWPTMLTIVLMGTVAATLETALSSLPQAIALAVGTDAGWLLLAFGGIVAQLVTTPFVAAATVLLYFDLRVRNEGMDLELAARRALDRAG